MVEKSNKHNIAFRPHFKTHQSHEVGQWFREFGIKKIAVSSVPMAEYFAKDGWDDITIAFPFVKQQVEQINILTNRAKLTLLVSSLANAKSLCRSINNDVDVLIEIDTGQHRSGILPTNDSEIEKIIEVVAGKRNTHFAGFLTHAGHSYQTEKEDFYSLHKNATEMLFSLKKKWQKAFPNLNISYGDTPTSLLCNDFNGVDELRPGNFAFFDMQQASRGVCSNMDIAIALVCPVVAIYPENNRAIIWGGAIHLSKDFYIDSNGKKSYGAVCKLYSDLTHSEPLDGLYVESLSQEHGVISAKNNAALAAIVEGELVAILPAHSCLTVDCMRRFWIANKGFFQIMER
jgi:D-serine deaminase-like pyridoxal phosphate-dependent protein